MVKKCFLFLIILSLATAVIYPQIQQKKVIQKKIIAIPSIKVLYPNGGETWYKEGEYTIRWQSNGISDDVKIIIKKWNGERYINYVEIQTPNDGTHRWKVPQKIGYNILPPGSYYKVEIATIDGSVKDESDGYFNIRDKAEVTSPRDIEIYPYIISVGQSYNYYTQMRHGELIEIGNFGTMGYPDKPYYKVVFDIKLQVRNVGNTDKSVDANVYFKRTLVKEFSNVATLAPGDSRTVELKEIVTPSIKKGDEVFELKVVICPLEQSQKPPVSFKNNTFTGFLRFVDYKKTGLIFDPKVIHIGKSKNLILFHYGEGKTLYPANLNFYEEVASNRYRIKVDMMKFTAKNTTPEGKRVTFFVYLGDDLVTAHKDNINSGESKIIVIRNYNFDNIETNKDYKIRIEAMDISGEYYDNCKYVGFIKFLLPRIKPKKD